MTVRFAACIRRIKKNRIHGFDVELSTHVAQLCRQLNIRRVPDIIVSDVLLGPAVLGIFRHTIVLPRCLLHSKAAVHDFSPKSLSLILVHELLHIRRGDLYTGALQAAVQCLWWFHPAVWFANRMLSRDAERCCDEQVIAELGCEPAEYARSLLSVIESKQPLQAVPVFPGMKPVEITFQRMERIMSLKHGSQKRMPLWHWAAVLGFGLLVLPGASSQNSETATISPPTRQQSNAPVHQSPTTAARVSAPNDENSGSKAAALSVSASSETKLTANSIVANVNGRPIILHDVIGSMPQALDAKEGLSDTQRQRFLKRQLRNRLHGYIQQELVVQALKKEVPEHRQHEILTSLEEPCRRLIADIRNARDVTTNKELDELLSTEGLSVHFLKQSFFRMQMVHGYLSSLTESPDVISRTELMAYYEAHRSDFTTGDGTAPFQKVRTEIERRLRTEYDKQAHQKVMQKLRANASVATMFGDAAPLPPAAADVLKKTAKSGRPMFGTGVNSDTGVIGSILVHQDAFEKPLGAGTDQSSQAAPELITVVYDVADLVAPIQKVVSRHREHHSAVLQASRESVAESENDSTVPVPAPVRPIADANGRVSSGDGIEVDFAPLVELIRTSVAPNSWSQEKGPGQISPYRNNLSIVIRQTRAAHDEVADLLMVLRKEHHLVIVADARIVQLPNDKDSDWIDQAIQLNPTADGLRWALSTESRTHKLLDYIAQGGGRVISTPRITTLPGHTAKISVSGDDDEQQPSRVSLSLTARPLSEGDLLRLSYRIGVDERLTTGGPGTGLLKSGQTLVIEYVPGDGNQVGVPVVRKVPYVNKLFRNASSRQGRYLIAITPRLLRSNVDEAAPDLTRADQQVSQSRRVTPPVAADK